MARFQFNLATALAAMTALASLLAVKRVVRGVPLWELTAALMLVAACWAAQKRKAPDLVFGAFVLAWQVAAYRQVRGIIVYLTVSSFMRGVHSPPHAYDIQTAIIVDLVSNFAVPMCMSLHFALFFGFRGCDREPSRARRWIIGSVIVVTLDALLLSVLTCCLWWRWEAAWITFEGV